MSAQNWKHIAEREFARLTAAGYRPAQIKTMMRILEGQFMELQLDARTQDEVSAMHYQLTTEFELGAALLIVQATHRTASYADRKNRNGFATEPPSIPRL